MRTDPEPTKVCRCGGTRFNRCSAKPDGLQSRCVDCMASAQRRHYRKYRAKKRKLRPVIDGVKQCDCGCNIFAKSASTRDGFQSMCATYMREAQRRHRKKARAKKQTAETVARIESAGRLIAAWKAAN